MNIKYAGAPQYKNYDKEKDEPIEVQIRSLYNQIEILEENIKNVSQGIIDEEIQELRKENKEENIKNVSQGIIDEEIQELRKENKDLDTRLHCALGEIELRKISGHLKYVDVNELNELTKISMGEATRLREENKKLHERILELEKRQKLTAQLMNIRLAFP